MKRRPGGTRKWPINANGSQAPSLLFPVSYNDILKSVTEILHTKLFPLVCNACSTGKKVENGLILKKVAFTQDLRPDEWASYRGCFCIDTFYRRGRFTQCEACPKDVRGYLCNETILVKEGYWWSFRDYNESWEYQRFVDALMTPDENFNHADVNFTGIFPKPYPCPKAALCLGLLNSVRKPCKTGYGGPLCEVRVR